MRILITGSRGVLGRKLTKILTVREHEVVGCDLQHAEETYSIKQTPQDTYIRCDIGCARQIARTLDTFRPDLVYNTAAEFGRWNGEAFYEQLWQTNVIGYKHILEEQRKRGFKLVHFSSSEVYGDFPGKMSEEVMDNNEIKQLNDYAISKWVNEMQTLNHIATKGGEVVRIRLFNTYGPGEPYHPFRSVNCLFTYRLLHGLPVTVYTDHQRTSTFIDDASRTIANIANMWHPGEVYNISSSSLHTIEDLAKAIIAETGADPSLITYCASEPMTTKTKLVDNTKIVQELGHIDTVTLQEGVALTVAWMKEYYKHSILRGI